VIGQKLGPYEVLAKLGQGGMGEVYRAHDPRLDRDVALKVVPQAFVLDAERLARFKREAQVLALLNHTNIAAIYGFEDAGGVQALVLEFVDGPSLAERIARGAAHRQAGSADAPIPIDETLSIALQIADALEAAHEQGIIHRDLKPSNIKLRPDGIVKVLDFGLAKAVGKEQDPAETTELGARASDRMNRAVSSQTDPTGSPTMTTPAITMAGVILGTAAYMSPEQARGRPAEKRSDIWAFGCVLYEMLTGVRAFNGEDAAETIADVIRGTPDWSKLPPATPHSIRRLLRRCLERDRKERLPHIGAARLDLKEALASLDVESPAVITPGASTPAVAPSAVPVLAARRAGIGRRERIAWTLLALSAASAIALALGARRPPATGPEMRLEIATPPAIVPQSLAVSPDGRKVVYEAAADGRAQLWLRMLDVVSARPIPRTEGASLPFWSPDSSSIGFFADGKLKRLDLNTGTVQELAEARLPAGGTWNSGGVILFAVGSGSPILRVPVSGGQPTAATELRTSRLGVRAGHISPRFLPDGRHFLYVARGDGLFVGQLDSTDSRRLIGPDVDRTAVYTADHLLYLRQGSLMAQRFDAVGLNLIGGPFPLAEAVAAVDAPSGSTNAPIAYRSGALTLERQLEWVGRDGTAIARVGPRFNANNGNPAISSDGRFVAVARTDGESPSDLWLLDTARGVFNRLTDDSFINNNPVFSPDGSRLIYQSNPKGRLDLYELPITGGSSKAVLITDENKAPLDWSADGRFLLYKSQNRTTGWDLWAVAMDGSQQAIPVVQSKGDDRDGQFSPDGRFVAYQSDESGQHEIYVQPYPGPGRKVTVSTNGGAQVRWRRDGKELFYVALDSRVMAVPISESADKQSLEPGTPVALFPARVGGVIEELSRQQYMVSDDGERFLMNTVSEEATRPITVILNWNPKR